MFETRITKLMGIQHPIIAGCMQRLSRAELVGAVSKAGALGVLSSVACGTAEGLREEIRKTRQITDRPFAVNINLFPARYTLPVESFIDTALEEGVRILETSGRSPRSYVERIKQPGVIWMHKCVRVRDAVSTERLGVDAVSIVGFECGGHPSHEDVGSVILVPLAVDAVSVPVIAGGGFADGRGLVAALALGADAVLMGTRFIATRECPIHDNVKERLQQAVESDTLVIQRSVGSNSRVLKTSASLKVLEMEARGASLQELLTITSGDRAQVLVREGDLEAGVLSCGQSVGLIKDVPTVAELIDSLLAQAEQARRRIAPAG